MSETKILVRQEKSSPGDWHVAAQGSEQFVEKAKLDIARADNTQFVVDRATGDIKGNNTCLSVHDKSDFKQ